MFTYSSPVHTAQSSWGVIDKAKCIFENPDKAKKILEKLQCQGCTANSFF